MNDLATPMRSRRGRPLTPLPDDKSAVTQLKMYLRECVYSRRGRFEPGPEPTLDAVAARVPYSKASLSKALNGTSVPTAEIVIEIARLRSQESIHHAYSLWSSVVLERLGLSPADLTCPNPRSVQELATIVRGHMATAVRVHEYEWGWRPIDVVMLLQEAKSVGAEPVSPSTINRMLAGKDLPTDRTLRAVLDALRVPVIARRRLLAARDALAECGDPAGIAA